MPSSHLRANIFWSPLGNRTLEGTQKESTHSVQLYTANFCFNIWHTLYISNDELNAVVSWYIIIMRMLSMLPLNFQNVLFYKKRAWGSHLYFCHLVNAKETVPNGSERTLFCWHWWAYLIGVTSAKKKILYFLPFSRNIHRIYLS